MMSGGGDEIATPSIRRLRRLVTLLVVVAVLLFAWTHRSAPTLPGFADDLGLLAELPERVATGGWWPDLASRLVGPLWPQSTMWRPLPYASFMFDALLWGGAAGGWHLTNLLLHLASAALVGLLARDLSLNLYRQSAKGSPGDDASATTAATVSGALSFALFLLCPWAPEVTLWLVGRFDGWATLWALLAVWTGLRGGVGTFPAAISVLAAALAYASKESALILVPWLAIVALFATPWRSATPEATSAGRRRWTLLIVAHLLLALAYASWRHHLFVGTAAAVYGSTPVTSLPRWAQQFAVQLAFPMGLASLASPAAVLSAGSAGLLLVMGWRDRLVLRVRLLGLAMAAGVVAALALYLPSPPGNGDGYRLYYIGAAGIAIALGAVPRQMTVPQLAAIITLVLASAQWQSRVAAEWAHASSDLWTTARALRSLAPSVPASDYALVLVPDQKGHVPFARNAQGGLIAFAQRTPAGEVASIDLLSRLVIFTPPQLNEWQRLAGEGIVQKLTQRADAPVNPTRYFCVDNGTGQARDLGHWLPTPAPQWSRRWRESVAAQCPTLPTNWP